MSTYANKTQENRSKSLVNTSSQKSSSESTFQFVDNRPETIAQRKLQEMANNSPQGMQLRAFQDMADRSHQVQVNQATQLQVMVDDHSLQQQAIQKKENNKGLPDNLKSGIENLSGFSMDDVKVHRNSDKPAQLQAHAYAQGTDIHLGPGQEKHLPHEAWHVVQQKQGRVKPTLQMKGEVYINDDAGLEKEADVMGKKALQKGSSNRTTLSFKSIEKNNTPAQLMRLTPQGAHSAMLDDEKKEALADQLLTGDLNVEHYMQGVCYDAVAFVRYLRGADISHNELLDTWGQQWLEFFNFRAGVRWRGGDIDEGTAVGFLRLVDDTIFHASISVGGTVVRGINGGLLGAGWAEAPRDLNDLEEDPDNADAFRYDGTSIQVLLSRL